MTGAGEKAKPVLSSRHAPRAYGLSAERQGIDQIPVRVSIQALAVRLTDESTTGGPRMKKALLIYIDEPALNEVAREHSCGETASVFRNYRTRNEIEQLGGFEMHCECDIRFENHRDKLIRETERYLSNPHNVSWARVRQSSRMACPWHKVPAA
jgi:hypothetical protein